MESLFKCTVVLLIPCNCNILLFVAQMEEFHRKDRIVQSCLARGHVGDISMEMKQGNCELKCYLSPHGKWCCVNQIGIKTNFPPVCDCPRDLFLRFCIYRPTMKELRFYNNHNQSNKQASPLTARPATRHTTYKLHKPIQSHNDSLLTIKQYSGGYDDMVSSVQPLSD